MCNFCVAILCTFHSDGGGDIRCVSGGKLRCTEDIEDMLKRSEGKRQCIKYCNEADKDLMRPIAIKITTQYDDDHQFLRLILIGV